MVRDVGMPHYICDVQQNLADTYLALNLLVEAQGALDEALTIAHKLGARPQMVKTLSSVVTYAVHLGQHQQAVVWAGFLIGDPEIESELFEPVCAELETALRSEIDQQGLNAGKTVRLDAMLSEILTLLSQPVG